MPSRTNCLLFGLCLVPGVLTLVTIAAAQPRQPITVHGACGPLAAEQKAIYAAGYQPDVAFSDIEGDRWTVWRKDGGAWRMTVETNSLSCDIAQGDRWDAELPLPGTPS